MRLIFPFRSRLLASQSSRVGVSAAQERRVALSARQCLHLVTYYSLSASRCLDVRPLPLPSDEASTVVAVIFTSEPRGVQGQRQQQLLAREQKSTARQPSRSEVHGRWSAALGLAEASWGANGERICAGGDHVIPGFCGRASACMLASLDARYPPVRRI